MYRILLADDTRLTLAVEKAYLEARNLKVFTTTEAREVLPLARSVQPDLVILDYEMPEMNGDEVCRLLKADEATAKIPVLILTSHDSDGVRRDCSRAGAAGFARKADGRDALMDLVAETLGVPQRLHVRVDCRFSVGILDSGAKHQATLHNLSEGGLYLTAHLVFVDGAALRLSFRLPGDETEISILGEIVRSEPVGEGLHGYGVQFLETSPESREALRSFITRTL